MTCKGTIFNASHWARVGHNNRWVRADGRFQIVKWDDRKTFAVMQVRTDGNLTQCDPRAYRSFRTAMNAADRY
jgi:hypothetical protein